MSDDYLINNISQAEFSVSEISYRIKQLLENNLGRVKIKGEISGLKIAASGHGYFSLKENNAVLSAICWRHTLGKINFKLEEGLEVIVTGKITSYPGQSKYQVSVELIEPYGIGAFMKILTERKQKLASEGLFAAEFKQKIPFLPKKIGIITSISGAVIKDIIHRISDRCPTNLVIWPVNVQGETSATEVSAAIDGFNKLDNEKKPDLLIVARGGGSIEDLWSFNEEIVVRAVFNSKIPIISAVGHETDYTLIDLAADLRAPTPTAAAEFAVPVIADLKYTLAALHDRSRHRILDLLKYYSHKVVSGNNSLMQIQGVINNCTQRMDELSFRLLGSLPNLLKQKLLLLKQFSISRIKPTGILEYKYLQYKNNSNNLLGKQYSLLTPFKHKLGMSTSLLQSLDYNNVLNRGFAMVKNDDNQIISSAREVEKSTSLYIKMKDGQTHVVKRNT
jgi:exodeoxyribonuclease VII large subunit